MVEQSAVNRKVLGSSPSGGVREDQSSLERLENTAPKGENTVFYCNRCAESRGWPITMFRSYGSCEICRKQATCSDMPSKYLPIPKEVKPKTDH